MRKKIHTDNINARFADTNEYINSYDAMMEKLNSIEYKFAKVGLHGITPDDITLINRLLQTGTRTKQKIQPITSQWPAEKILKAFKTHEISKYANKYRDNPPTIPSQPIIPNIHTLSSLQTTTNPTSSDINSEILKNTA